VARRWSCDAATRAQWADLRRVARIVLSSTTPLAADWNDPGVIVSHHEPPGVAFDIGTARIIREEPQRVLAGMAPLTVELLPVTVYWLGQRVREHRFAFLHILARRDTASDAVACYRLTGDGDAVIVSDAVADALMLVGGGVFEPVASHADP
jgi:hypothetical protein